MFLPREANTLLKVFEHRSRATRLTISRTIPSNLVAEICGMVLSACGRPGTVDLSS